MGQRSLPIPSADESSFRRRSQTRSRSRSERSLRRWQASRSYNALRDNALPSQMSEESELQRALSASTANLEKIATLVQMGISEQHAREALEATANDINAAADRILSGDEFKSAGPRHSADDQGPNGVAESQ